MRLPWTIWLYVLADLWRLLVLTTAVLLVVVSFAATVRYTADGRLGPLETLRFMFLAMLPMLQYALPFAAGFAATLSYHRMTQDHELTAAAASGVSHRALLIPALVSGLALAGGLEWLSGNLIPGFLKSMEQLVTRDAAKLVVSTIESGRPIENNHVVVYADGVHTQPHDPGRGVYQRLVLSGVFVLKLDDAGRIISEITARRAHVEFSTHTDGVGDTAADSGPGSTVSGATDIDIVLVNASGRNEDGTVMSGETVPLPRWTMPGVFGDDPKYLTNAQMAAVPEHPEMLGYIDSRRRELAVQIAARDTFSAIDTALRSGGVATLTSGVGEQVVIRAVGLKPPPPKSDRWVLVPRAQSKDRGIEIEVFPPGGASGPDMSGGVRLSAAAGSLRNDPGKASAEHQALLELELESVAIRSRDMERGTEWEKRTLTGLTSTIDPLPTLRALNSRQLLAEVGKRTAHGPDPYLSGPADDLARELRKLGHEVIGKRSERTATAVACMVMILAGALTAMRLGTSLPLTVYLWSFFPALVAVLTISGGQQMTRQVGLGGLAVLWGGVGLLCIYTAAAFAVVRRH